MLADSVSRLRSGMLTSSAAIKEFVLTKTFLGGKLFSLHNHEYQGLILDIVSDLRSSLVVMKPSQLGATEVIIRAYISACYLVGDYKVAILMPSATMVQNIFKLRVNPMIASCPELRSAIDRDVDSASLKRFINDSTLHGLSGSGDSKGTILTNPLNRVICDELARLDADVVEAMLTRMKHGGDKQGTVAISTPMFAGFDIDHEIGLCGTVWEQHFRCGGCGKYVDYQFERNTVLPGYDGSLYDLSLVDVERSDSGVRLNDAWFRCHLCGGKVEYHFDNSKWVDTADVKGLEKVGVKLGALAAPAFVGVPELIHACAKMSNKSEFNNQFLGEAVETSSLTLDLDHVIFMDSYSISGDCFIGLDVGVTSTLVVGYLSDGVLTIIGVHFIGVQELRTRVVELYRKYNAKCMVIDYLPYTDTVKALYDVLPNVWAAQYERPRKPVPGLFSLKESTSNEVGELAVVRINYTNAFDEFANRACVDHNIKFACPDKRGVVKEQLGVMLKQEKTGVNGEVYYDWVKPTKLNGGVEDHIHHACVYLMTASMLNTGRGISSYNINTAGLVSKFKLHDF